MLCVAVATSVPAAEYTVYNMYLHELQFKD